MDTALPQKFSFILDRNLAKANGTGNRVCTSCDTVVFDFNLCVEWTDGFVFIVRDNQTHKCGFYTVVTGQIKALRSSK